MTAMVIMFVILPGLAKEELPKVAGLPSRNIYIICIYSYYILKYIYIVLRI